MKRRYIKPIIQSIPAIPSILATSSEDIEIGTGEDITPEDGNVWGDSKHHDFDLPNFEPFQYDDEE